MDDHQDERRTIYLGQEAGLVLNNAAFVEACQALSAEATDQLVQCDASNIAQVMRFQAHAMAVSAIIDTLESMAARANSILQSRDEERSSTSTLN